MLLSFAEILHLNENHPVVQEICRNMFWCHRCRDRFTVCIEAQYSLMLYKVSKSMSKRMVSVN